MSNGNFRPHFALYTEYSPIYRCKATPRQLALMSLGDNASPVYVQDDSGEPLDDELVYTDKSGHYFIFDELTGCAYRTSGLRISGNVRWKYKHSQPCITYDSIDALYEDYFGRAPW